ncbi:hypothetical protein pneo_cds_707 [Pandoravirus neocaledonia]|uniref:Uncharacterized protein n=1 Tax=Pandoravirus neocaledonia TaxID=2107708 RepID=A0A2U7UCY3_9VIRU|nr:hypothetical protein pneo_cds_707 [Pandoravirus neocaledonia]AVK76314.1 hypothetical protein pneo_cds_707 [Pandoravirus neocaledonia]
MMVATPLKHRPNPNRPFFSRYRVRGRKAAVPSIFFLRFAAAHARTRRRRHHYFVLHRRCQHTRFSFACHGDDGGHALSDRGKRPAHSTVLAWLFGLRRIAADHDWSPSVAIVLCNERKGACRSGCIPQRHDRGIDDDLLTPGKKPHYGVFLGRARLIALVASATTTAAVMKWLGRTASRPDHAGPGLWRPS